MKINNENSGKHLLRAGGKVSILSNSAFNSDLLSSCTLELCNSLNNLSGMDNSEKLREDAIANGKAIIKNWKPPTTEQIDQIFSKMLKAEKLA